MGSPCLFLPCMPVILRVFLLRCARNVGNLVNRKNCCYKTKTRNILETWSPFVSAGYKLSGIERVFKLPDLGNNVRKFGSGFSYLFWLGYPKTQLPHRIYRVLGQRRVSIFPCLFYQDIFNPDSFKGFIEWEKINHFNPTIAVLLIYNGYFNLIGFSRPKGNDRKLRPILW